MADNAPRVLVLENQPLGPIESFCLLNLEIPGIIISLGVTFAPKFRLGRTVWEKPDHQSLGWGARYGRNKITKIYAEVQWCHALRSGIEK